VSDAAGVTSARRRLLALDVGDRRIGVAVSDELGMTAQGVSTIHRRSWAADLAEIARLADHWDAVGIVVGLPLTLAGTVGPRTRIVQDFISRLERVVRVPITTWDERFSTATVERVLIDADVSRAKRKLVIDKAAAVVILQDFLDARSNRDAEGRS
jgi:putative Holliday junction resolvase